MRELKIYFGILRKFSLIFILLPFSGLAAGLVLTLLQPKFYSAEAMYEVSYTNENIEIKKNETDQLVGVLRDENVDQIVNLSNVQKVEIYKPAPISLHVRITSNNQENSRSNLNKIEQFIFSRSSVRRLFVKEEIAGKYNWIQFSLAGFGLGVIVAYLITLVRLFMRNY